ncbi:Caspase domain-containing protein [Bosea lupini]|uniref:Caspase domain-containing protein n=2 Tax=Bosea lupini TaxID=1036779 RepID=A0A1H7WHW0_9HYPH|nr:Caspase domain-containing protein [Bosea lupini]
MRAIVRAALCCLGLMWFSSASAQTPVLSDNADSIAVVIGNKEYRRTSTVDFAHNDAEAIKAYLTGTLGFREQNVFLVKDATLGELTQMFGSEANPTGSQLWRSAVAGRSNVFVYYSGHGVPDLGSRQPFLLPHDGNPNVVESGYALQTLYRNLELVRQKIGTQRQLIVMIDACFTGETGRIGESLLAVSAPGFTPAKPRAGDGIVKLVATSGTTPANWDQSQKLGLFTSRFLMGAAGLARPAGAPESGPLAWSDLQRYLKDSVEAAARRDSGREQAPEIDLASIALPMAQPVPAVARAVALARDEANWQRAKATGERSALESYIARCGEICRYRDQAMALLMDKVRGAAAARDQLNWQKLSADGQYAEYLKSCEAICAYRAIAQSYLGPARTADQTKADNPAAKALPPQAAMRPTIPRRLITRGFNGRDYVEGRFERVGPNLWEEKNSQTGKVTARFRVVRQSETELVLHDPSRKFLMRFDLLEKTSAWQLENQTQWNALYDIVATD